MIVNVGLKRTQLTLAQRVSSILRKYGTDAHVYLPGIGVINGLTAGNYLDSAGTTAATVDNPVGLVVDSGGINAIQATTANKPILRRGAVNLLTYSEQFDNAAWTKTTTTVAANAIAAPNSTTTADTLTAGGANSTTLHSYTAIAQPYTFSIYIRRRTGTGTIEITADGSTYVAKTITSDWARYDTTITPTAGTRTPGVRIVTSGDAIDVWGAQLEIGSTATTYNPTTVKNLLGFSESFDNAAWAKSNSFVQTNLLTYSEAFDNAAWTKDSSAITANSVVAPNGYQTADKLTTTTASAQHSLLTPNISVTSGVAYTHTYYAKKGDVNFFFIGWSTPFFGAFAPAYFNLETGEVTTSAGTTATITNVGNGWWRCSATRTATATGLVQLRVGLTDSNTNTTSTGANTTDGIFIWGAQLVQGSVAGDYRRTDAAALPIFYPNHNGVVCAQKLVEAVTAPASTIGLLSVVTTAANLHTFSFYAKAGERNWIRLGLTNITQAQVWFNLSTGLKGTQQANVYSASITPAGNGWYRCSTTVVLGAGAMSMTLRVADADGSTGYAGDGTSGIYIWGAQLQTGSVATDYVPTTTAAKSSPTGNYWWQFDGTDVLTATFPAGYESATTIDARTTGHVTLTAQNIVGAYNIGPSIDTYGRFIFRTGLTAGELATMQTFANRLAGV